MVLALTTLAASLVFVTATGTPAQAAPLASTPLVTINLQGASAATGTGSTESKWSTSVLRHARQAEIVTVQEAGSFNNRGIPGRAEALITTPAGNVEHRAWEPHQERFELYALETDPTGNRNNMAIVTQRPADEVTSVVNPSGRAALGVRFNNNWYFTFHGRSNRGQPNDTEDMLRRVAARAGARHWAMLGDFNRDPNSITVPAGARIYNPGEPTHIHHGEYDYVVASEHLQAPIVNVLAGATPDHFAVGFGALRAAAEPVDLATMPLGDSITDGYNSSDKAGYRIWLYGEMLASPVVRRDSLNFVGSQRSGRMRDPDHEGHSSWEIAQIAAAAHRSVPRTQPNVVMLHAGTNDMNNNSRVATAPDRLAALVDQLLRDAPKTTVLVATLIPASNPVVQARIDTFNARVRELVDVRAAQGKHVRTVNMGQVTTADLADGLHPNASGYRKMGWAFKREIEWAIDIGWVKDASSPDAPACDDTAGRWIAKGQVASGTGSGLGAQIEFADIDGDDKDDYLVVGSKGQVNAWINDGGDTPGRSGWIPRGQIASGTGVPGTVRFADIDGDHRDDYLVVGSKGQVNAWMNDGGDTPGGSGWIPRGQIASGTDAPGTVRFADIDGDDKDDYLVLNGNGEVRAWINVGGDTPGRSGWISRGMIASGTNAEGDVQFAAFSCDRRADYLVVDRFNAVQAWINDGGDTPGRSGWIPRGQIASGVAPASAAPVVFADIDGDGRDDYLLLYPNGSVQAWINNGGDPA
jgi:lysophospholipase L1-like esterase